MFEPPPDQPQSVGDLIGRAFRVYRRHIPLFFKVLIGPTIVSTFGALGLQWSVTYGAGGGQSSQVELPLLIGIVSVSSIVLVITKWILTVRQLAFVRIMAGFARDYPTAYEYVRQRRWAVLGLYAIGAVFMVFSMGAWIVELSLTTFLPKVGLLMALLTVLGVVVGVVGVLATMALIVMVGFLVFSVAACENQPVGVLISRGISLTMNDFWRASAFGILLFIAISAISCPLSLPVVVLSLVDMFQQGVSSETLVDSYRMPLYLMVVSQVWESLVNMLLWPVIFMAYGLLYYDLRLRQEGLDLARRLDALEQQAASQTA